MIDISGVFPPLPTSFNSKQDIDTEKMQLNIRKLCSYDLAGFLILGSNGELVMLSEKEKGRVYDAAREAIPPGKKMLAGTGGQSTRETIRLTKAAAKSGADAALVLNPSYYKGLMSTEALVAHYHDVADASDIPIIIYNMPANSGLDMDGNTILAISKHENIIGLKDSGGNLGKMAQIIANSKPGFQVLAGSAGFFLPALSIGAVGGILALANVLPGICLKIHQKFLCKDLNEAAELQRSIVELNTALTRGWGVPALKTAMDHSGFYGGPCRKPIQELAPDKKNLVHKMIGQVRNL